MKAAFEAVFALCLQSQSIDLNASPLMMLLDAVLALDPLLLAVRDNAARVKAACRLN